MKCKNCDASMIETHAESYEQDFYCLCGIEDKERIEEKDGSLGCNLHYSTVRRCMRLNNEMAENEYLRSGY